MRKLSKAESGRLGAQRSKEVNALRKQERIDDYLLNPTTCKQCHAEFDYDGRKKSFCDKKCAAVYNNLQRDNRTVSTSWNCASCGKEHTTVKWRIGKYCNIICQKTYENKERVRQWLEEGNDWKTQVPSWAKKYLAEQRGYNCEVCSISEWNGKPLVLEVDHVDGTHSNNDPGNLRLICPNCHSQTDTYKAKNRGNGRKYRLKPA